MAKMTEEWTIATDLLLDGLEQEWQAGLELIARWDALSDYEQMVFVEEWAIPRGYYQELQTRCKQGRLDVDEHRRFDELIRMIELHRPVVEVILEASAI